MKLFDFIDTRVAEKWLIGIFIVLGILHVLSRVLFDYADGAGWDFGKDLAQRFNVDQEASLPTWYSTVLIFTMSLSAFWYATKTKHKRAWQLLGLVLLLMSIDEGSSFHEIFIWPLRRTLDIGNTTLLSNSWILLGAIAAAMLAYGLYKFLALIKPSSRLYFIFGFAAYLVGVLVVEAVGGTYDTSSQTYQDVVVLIEELFEIGGLTLVSLGILNEIQLTKPT